MKIISLQISEDEAKIIKSSLELFEQWIPMGTKDSPKEAKKAIADATAFVKLKVSSAIEDNKGA